MPYISQIKFQIKTITSSEISQLSVTYGVIGEFTTGDGVKRPVCQRVFSREKNSNSSARRKTVFFTRISSRNICIFLWKVNEMTLAGYFPLKVNKNLGLQNDAEPTLWNKSLEKR